MAKLGRLLAAAALALGASAADNQAAETDRLNNESLIWGPYKPNLYFGVRPRVPQGLWTGLMWGGVNSYQQVPDSK